MINRILVPTDFSNCSINAVRYATRLSKKLKSVEVLIMHASMPSVPSSATDLTSISEQKEEIKEGFEIIANAIPELNDIDYTTITEDALLFEAITSLSASSNIDLIVMGTMGALGIDEIIHGTNTYTVIKQSKCPVLVIPEKVNFKPISHILMASDLKEIDYKTFEPVKFIAQLFSSKISIVHIDENDNVASNKLDEAKKFETYFKDINHDYNYIKNIDVEKGINDYISQNKADLLTLIIRWHPLYDLIFGSGESKNLIFHTKMPLLAIPEVY